MIETTEDRGDNAVVDEDLERSDERGGRPTRRRGGRGRDTVGRLVAAVLVGAGIGLPLGAWMTPDRVRFAVFVVGSGVLGGWVERLRSRRSVRRRTRPPGSGLSLRRGVLVALLGGALAVGILWARENARSPFSGAIPHLRPVPETGSGASPVESVRHRVRPPRYTEHRPWEGAGLGVTVPARSDVAWRIEVAEAVEWVRLETPGGGATLREERPDHWVLQRRIHGDTRVRLRISRDGDSSYTGSWMQVEVIPDHPPTARIVQPAGPVFRSPSAPGSLAVEVELADDYGLSEADLVGEHSVSGGEEDRREIRWALFSGDDGESPRRRVVRRVLDLAALDPSVGSELSLWVEVFDNRSPRPREGRSEIRIVRFDRREVQAKVDT